MASASSSYLFLFSLTNDSMQDHAYLCAMQVAFSRLKMPSPNDSNSLKQPVARGRQSNRASVSKRSKQCSADEQRNHIGIWVTNMWQQGERGRAHVDRTRRLVQDRLIAVNRREEPLPEKAAKTDIKETKTDVDKLQKSLIRSKVKKVCWFPPISRRTTA